MKTKLVLSYGADVVERPVIYNLIQQHHLVCNIIKAEMDGNKHGYLVLDVEGSDADFNAALAYLKASNVTVNDVEERISWDEEVCVQCGACTGVCPTGALAIVDQDMGVAFDGGKCILCHSCLKACPFGALRVKL